ncbi:MAG: mechanosensitive ion channel family protein [Phycisphaerae bacterium]|nr:mechanosensitive ion channel family protein [Phycisphaerae bacterium]
MIEMLREYLVSLGLADRLALLVVRSVAVLAIAVIALAANWIARRFLLRVIGRFIAATRARWDDVLVRRRVFDRLAHLAPAVIVHVLTPVLLPGLREETQSLIQRVVLAYVAVIVILILDALIDVIHDVYQSLQIAREKPIKSYLQVANIALYFLGLVFVVAILMQQSPWKFLTGLGALTAVLLLVFKDAILGFVASIQIAANQMVRRGDWIAMEKYGADGDVIDISLTTVKVQNWDKTVTTIPTYALISDSFKNWRGMAESGGRRIKRAICIDMTSVRFCTPEMLAKFSRIHRLTDYIERKRTEIAEYNAQHNVDPSVAVNGRRMTNLGTFRAYVENYLRHHPRIHKNMTFMVRQLDPTPCGLPIEIYAFSNDQAWVSYESIQADIFDHVLAVVPEFDLRVFQYPSGADIQALLAR